MSDRHLYAAQPQLCIKCKGAMECCDVDYNFPGNQDEYYYCPKCHMHLYVVVRYGKVIKKRFNKEE